MAKVYRAPYDPPNFDPSLGFEENDRRENAYIDKLAAEARENGNSDLLGKVVRWQRGDGYALYMVWNTRPLELIHLERGDAWSVEEALIRGLRVSDIKQMVERNEKLSALFSRS